MTMLQAYLACKLEADGYDGLCSPGCGCTLEDLWPCDGPGMDCVPGYRHACEECPRKAEDNCPMEDGGDWFCVTASKEWPKAEVET